VQGNGPVSVRPIPLSLVSLLSANSPLPILYVLRFFSSQTSDNMPSIPGRLYKVLLKSGQDYFEVNVRFVRYNI